MGFEHYSSLHGFITKQKNDQLPAGLLCWYLSWKSTTLVSHRSCGFKSYTGLNFFRHYFHYCLSSVHYCKEGFYIYVLSFFYQLRDKEVKNKKQNGCLLQSPFR